MAMTPPFGKVYGPIPSDLFRPREPASLARLKSQGRKGDRQEAQRYCHTEDQSQGGGAATRASGRDRTYGKFDAGRGVWNSGRLARIERMRQDLTHDVRQGFAGDLG